MKRICRISLIAFAGILLLSSGTYARKSNRNMQDMYVFAISMSFSDSVMYMSTIQKIDGVVLRDKYFFDERAGYANQFKKWMEEETSSQQLAALYYLETRKKADRKYAQIRKQAIKKHGGEIVTVPDFKFRR